MPLTPAASPPMVVGAEATATTAAFDAPAGSVVVAVLGCNHYGQGTTYTGEEFAAADQRGEVLVVNVWYAACPPCRKEAPELQAINEEYAEDGVQFDYEMAMGVRYGEREWKQQIEGLIASKQADIQAILKEFGVPLLAPVGEQRRQ